MAYIKYSNVGIKAVSACVPKTIVGQDVLKGLIPEEDIEKTINSIGIKEKRYADEDTCASDLCVKAAEKLFEDNQIDKSEIDALIFVCQTSDYHQPATAPSIQHRLGLSTSVLSFDINLACSGYVYGLSVAYSFAAQEGIRNVLLLVGETMSKMVSKKDKESYPLFGDAGTATLVSKGDFGDSWFSLNSDGSGKDIMQIPYGGFRKQSCKEGFEEYTDNHGNVRTGEQFYMNGMEVFNFGMRVEPKDVKGVVAFAEKTIEDLDVVIFHQANKFMTDFFAKRLKISSDKVPYCLDRFGNTSSASIPLTIVSELYDSAKYPKRGNVLMSGFGAGLSWGCVIANISQSRISELVEY